MPHEVISVRGTMQLYVCTTCRLMQEPAEPPEQRGGARLFRALEQGAAVAAGIDIVPVECMSVCRRPCTIGFGAPGKWTYVYGDFHPETSADEILAAAAMFAAAADGIIPWKQRPDSLKRGVVARVPPLPIRPNAGGQP